MISFQSSEINRAPCRCLGTCLALRPFLEGVSGVFLLGVGLYFEFVTCKLCGEVVIIVKAKVCFCSAKFIIIIVSAS